MRNVYMLKCPSVFIIKGFKFSMDNLLSGFPKPTGYWKEKIYPKIGVATNSVTCIPLL